MKVNISCENTCFDYIEYAEYADDNLYVVSVFVEPIGNVCFTSKDEENMKKHLERLFNAQPIEYDYIKAGHIIHHNRTQPLIHREHVENIDVESFWSDVAYKRAIEQLDEKTELDVIREELEKQKVFLRLNEGIDDEYHYRDGLVLEVQKVKDLGNGYEMLLATESSKNVEVGIERENHVHDWVVKRGYSLKDHDIEVFFEENWEEKKKEMVEYEKYKDDMSLEEFLEKRKHKRA